MARPKTAAYGQITGVTSSGGLVASALVRGCSSQLAARRLAVLLGLTAVLALPAAGGAAAPSSGVAELRQQDTSLAAKERAATQALYSLEAQLAAARSRLEALTAQREAAETRLTRLRIELDVAWQSAYIAEEHLGARIRQLYEEGLQDPLAILLGAESLDEAIGGLDSLRSIAAGDRDLLRTVRRARAELSNAKARVVARVAALREAETAAETEAAPLAAASAERRAYLAQLARQRGFNARRLERVRATARAAGERTAEAVATTSLEVVASTAAPAPAYAGGEQTMTVSATGYALRGRTASGLPTGWGIVAVDPSVIPLGTRMTIPGYGEGVAADTGGAVRGATIDLWFPSVAQALAWGRRTVTITLHG
jgi:3D (Asp-Asp-Asp) domain-containing protein